jgi:acetylornithine deacetylase/succinyl-diaminopimelate desuccinylase-like protein
MSGSLPIYYDGFSGPPSHYSSLSQNVFRFLPLRLTSRDLERMHGIDERIGIHEYEAAIRTHRQFVVEAAGSGAVKRLAHV